MNKFLKALLGLSCAAVFSISHADMATMTKYYNNPSLAPKVKRCGGDQDCNAFFALSKQWKSVPNCFNTAYGKDCSTKKEAARGNGYSLWKGASFNKERSSDLAWAAEDVFYNGGGASQADERIFAEGLAVLYYLDSKK